MKNKFYATILLTSITIISCDANNSLYYNSSSLSSILNENSINSEIFEPPVLYSPHGTVSKGNITFSWEKSSNKFFEKFLFELNSITNYFRSEVFTFVSHISLNQIPIGTYEWRVTPILQNEKHINSSDWVVINVVSELSSEVIFGIEKNQVTPLLSTKLSYPESAVYGPDGAIYVSDSLSNVIKKCDIFCTPFIGNFLSGYNGDNHRNFVQLNQPAGIVFDSQFNMIFQDTGNFLTRKLDYSSDNVTTISTHSGWSKNIYIASDGSFFKTIQEADKGYIYRTYHDQTTITILDNFLFRHPIAIEIIGDKVLILDNQLRRLFMFLDNKLIKEFDTVNDASGLFYDGEFIYIGAHTVLFKLDLDLNIIQFNDTFANISHISKGKNNKLLITDSDLGSVFEVDKFLEVKTILIGSGSKHTFGNIVDLVQFQNYLYLLDNKSATVWRYNLIKRTIERYLGTGEQDLAKIGELRSNSSLFFPSGLAVDNYGHLYVGEQHHILKINRFTDKVELFAGAHGRGTFGYFGDNGPASEALFYGIRGIHYDQVSDSILVADTFNNRIRKINKDRIVSTIAGNGIQGQIPVFNISAIYSSLNKPHKITTSPNGEIYISDSWSNLISKIDSQGFIRHVAGVINFSGYQGNGSFSGDNGYAILANLNTPNGLFFYEDTLFFTDTFNHRIRMIKGAKIITIIGGELNGFSAIDSKVLNMPNGILVTKEGEVFLADTENSLLRKYHLSDLLPS